MTLIKKLSQLHKSANATNLLSMALIMSAVSCGCGDEDKGNDEAVEFTMDIKKPAADIPHNVNYAELEGEIKVTKGEFKPTDWTLKLDKVTATKDGAATPTTATIKLDQEGKPLTDAGMKDNVKKDGIGKFKVKFVTDGNDFADSANTAAKKVKGKVTLKVSVNGKKKDKDGKETPDTKSVDTEFTVA